MPEIDLNKAVARIDLPTFTFNKVKFKVRKLTRSETVKIDENETIEEDLREADEPDKVVKVLLETLDLLVEPVVKTGKGGKKISALLMLDWQNDRITLEDITAIRNQILGAKETALRPT